GDGRRAGPRPGGVAGRRLGGVHRPGHDRRHLPPPPADRRGRAQGAAGLMAATTYAWLVIAFPLAGMLLVAGGFRRLRGRSAGWIATCSILLSFAAAVGTLIALQQHTPEHRQLVSSLYDYAVTVGVDGQMSILVDPLSVFMILTVTGVSLLIHVYSIAYMDRDAGYARFFAYLNFFVFSMLLLVLAGNFLVLIIGWAFVGA